jgi:hypothetical protein
MEKKCWIVECVNYNSKGPFGCLNENMAIECQMRHPVFSTEWHQNRKDKGDYVYKCFSCKSDLNLQDNERCSACGGFICPVCDKCFCHATVEQIAEWEARRKR